MNEHIPDSASTYILIDAEDLKNFGWSIATWSVVGAVSLAGFAIWWEQNEDDRKAKRKAKRRLKAKKEVERIAKLDAKRAEKQV